MCIILQNVYEKWVNILCVFSEFYFEMLILKVGVFLHASVGRLLNELLTVVEFSCYINLNVGFSDRQKSTCNIYTRTV